MNIPFPPLNRQTAQIPSIYPERVVQFGGGNFIRAFVDWIIEALNEQAGFAGSVVVVKPTPHGSYDQLNVQEGLFHVRLHGLQQGKLVTTRQLITCVSRTVNPYTQHAAFAELAHQPDIRFIVSNTTESGLSFAPDDQLTDAPPASFPAKLTQFLYRRFQHFQGGLEKGCIVLPCELVDHNGHRLQQLVLDYAKHWQLGADFKHWIETANQFYNTIVDRIVPGFPKQDAVAIMTDLGFDDQLLVEAELYHSWIIEAPQTLHAELPVHRTNLNIQLVADVERFREIKVRLLNGAHTAMTPLGHLLGLETVRQAVEHDWLGPFVQKLLYEEIIPSFATADPILEQFAVDGLNRFRNPFIHHRLLSIALNSISKFKVRLLPSLYGYMDNFHRLPKHIIFAFAALIRFYKGSWNGKIIPLNDDPAVIAWFQEQWQAEIDIRQLVERVLANRMLWEQDLTQVTGLADLLTTYLIGIDKADHRQLPASSNMDNGAVLSTALKQSYHAAG